MLDEAPEGGGFEFGAGRVVHAYLLAADLSAGSI
jgi:hypothetical protein